MDMPLEEQYLIWLYHQVASVRIKNPTRTYWSLIRLLHAKEFDWFVPNDDNRVEDGRDLRREFVTEFDIQPPASWMRLGCSMLEMLIAMSRRLSFEAEGTPRGWFWELLENIELQNYNDNYFESCDTQLIVYALNRVIDRTYDADGHGGLFPLNESREDQTEVELWNQASIYLMERE
jgi:hypothetical protein